MRSVGVEGESKGFGVRALKREKRKFLIPWERKGMRLF